RPIVQNSFGYPPGHHLAYRRDHLLRMLANVGRGEPQRLPAKGGGASVSVAVALLRRRGGVKGTSVDLNAEFERRFGEVETTNDPIVHPHPVLPKKMEPVRSEDLIRLRLQPGIEPLLQFG